MSAVNVDRVSAPQAFTSSYAPRIRTYGNSLLTPVQAQNVLPSVRTTKRGTTAINYAEEFEDDSIEDSDGPRRSMGLRTNQQRRELNPNGDPSAQKELGKEVYAPVDVQGIWRDWMGKPKRALTEKQMHIQSALPTTLVPIRIDLDVVPFRPEAALPTPNNYKDYGIDESLPAYKAPEPTPQFRLKDSFLWNLHEAIITPDNFAKTFVDELDFPVSRKIGMIAEIAQQIRQQLEEHAPTALHPLFQPSAASDPTSTPALRQPVSREDSSAPMQTSTPHLSHKNGHHLMSGTSTPLPNGTSTPALAVTAHAFPQDRSVPSVLNPPDSHRCVLHLSINLQNRLYTDKFEWSLLHPPGFAETFARQTCADMGLSGEWVPSMALAIYEASLRLKKDMIENGGSLAGVVGSDVDNWGVVDNEACEFHGTAESALGVGAGWRFDEDGLGFDWEPKIEELSKEEIEKREGDRERQLRRARRDTARFTNTYNLQTQSSGMNDYFSGGLGTSQVGGGGEDERMGRGERAKKKRRFRSLSPVGGETPEIAGFGGTSQQLTEGERQYWHCSHCKVWGQAVWGVRDGPGGAKVRSSVLVHHLPPTDMCSSRLYATIADCCTNATSAFHRGTTTSSPTRRTKALAKPPPRRPRPTVQCRPRRGICSPTSHRTPRARRRRGCNTTTSTPRHTSTRAPRRRRVAARARSRPRRWQTSSTTRNRARIWTGRRSRSRGSGSGCRTSSTGASIENGDWRRKGMEGVEATIPGRTGRAVF